MTLQQIDHVALMFMLHAVQEWGDPLAERLAAVQAVLDATGFKARATCYPIFGGIWRTPCQGPDAEAATQWLKDLTDTLPRGEFNTEARHVAAAIAQRQARCRIEQEE